MAGLIENTILGINISHDTSIAVVKDGVLVDVFEEERCRRAKYWAPKPDEEARFQSIEQKINIESIDEVVFASFDRRCFDYNIDKTLSHDRLATREFMKDMTEHQLSRERLEEIAERYVDLFTFAGEEDGKGGDLLIADDIIQHHFDLPEGEYLYNIDHHVHHAWCGFTLSDMDDALVITMDGGGCRKRWDDYPTHQEIESIYYGDLDEDGNKNITPLYQKLSNYRFVSDLSEMLPNELYDCLMSKSVDSFRDNEVDYDMVSTPSMGMNFSNLSFALGTDKLGRAAGKVMGMASYGLDLPIKQNYTAHGLSGMLQNETVEHTKKLLERLVEYKPECKNIILSGGYALNCVGNYKYLEMFPNHNFFIDPCAHDGGTAIGSCVKNTFYQDKGYTL